MKDPVPLADAVSDSNALVVLIGALTGVIGGAIVWVAGWLKGRRKDAIAEWQELFERQVKDHDAFKADMAASLDAIKAANAAVKVANADLNAQNAGLKAQNAEINAQLTELIASTNKERQSLHAQRNEENARHMELLAENQELRRQLESLRETANKHVGRVEHAAKSIANAVIKQGENIARNSENINLLACRSGEIPVVKDQPRPPKPPKDPTDVTQS